MFDDVLSLDALILGQYIGECIFLFASAARVRVFAEQCYIMPMSLVYNASLIAKLINQQITVLQVVGKFSKAFGRWWYITDIRTTGVR